MLQLPYLRRPWSQIGIRLLIASLTISLITIIVEGILIRSGDTDIGSTSYYHIKMYTTWLQGCRYVCEILFMPAMLLIVGGKFIETRTILSIGFDTVDGSKMVCKGADEDNIVWIGRRYGTRLEAEAVAEAIAERMTPSTGRS